MPGPDPAPDAAHDDRTAPLEPVDAGAVAGFDETADVVVVGLGIAGVCAAIEAAEAGAEVVALERAGAAGGTSALSGGLVYLGGGTPVQLACGFEDDPETMAGFLAAACGPGADDDKIRAYCEGSVAHFHWLVDHGVPFKPEFHPEPNREPPTDAGLIYSGGEDTWPFCDEFRSAPRGHHPQFPDTAGGFLMDRLRATLAARPVAVRTDTRVERLVVDDGAVVGVRTRDGRHLRARRGVVLTGGGFITNEAMVARHCPDAHRPDPAWRIGTDADDGTAIRIGQGAGGAVARMDAFECALPFRPPDRMARWVLVNGDGRRFVNEDTYTGRIGYRALVEERGEVFAIVDESTYQVNFVGMRLGWAAETVEELAAELGLPPDGLAATVAEYNAGAERGEDPAFHKGAAFLEPLRPPFGAVDLRVGSGTIYATFTLGGLTVDPDARVLDGGGDPVPGLFAAGRCTAGIAAHGYVSGISLGDGSFFGRRAGRSAASGPPVAHG